MDWRDNVPEWLAESWDTLNTDMKTVIYVMASGVKKYNLWKNT